MVSVLVAKLAEKDDELARAKERQELENLDYQKLKGKYADLQEKIAQEEARRLVILYLLLYSFISHICYACHS